jgi:hypothetical protein
MVFPIRGSQDRRRRLRKEEEEEKSGNLFRSGVILHVTIGGQVFLADRNFARFQISLQMTLRSEHAGFTVRIAMR